MGGREIEERGGRRQNKKEKKRKEKEGRMRVRGRKRERRGVEDGVTHECIQGYLPMT